MKCRHCKTELKHEFINLGFQPPSNSYINQQDLNKPEISYPLRVLVCDNCWLVQTEDFVNKNEFFNTDYAYFSSTSTSWLEHAKNYVQMIVEKLNLTQNSFVIEIAANDGYLLKNFINSGIPCIGIEPTNSTADVAESQGIEIVREFFGLELANDLNKKYQFADLVIGNNVFAHVPDINDFSSGIEKILKDNGVVTLEFPHLVQLISQKQFDTIYHEHFSYLSLTSVCNIFEKNGLRVFDVEEIITHGGSLRVYGCKKTSKHSTTNNVNNLLNLEKKSGVTSLQYYLDFQNEANRIKNNLLKFLIKLKEENKSVVAYGAAAKGNTLLNFAGISVDLLPIVVDAAKSKQNKLMPGSRIPIKSPDILTALNPNYILILPWNISNEILNQNQNLVKNGSKFFKAIPALEVI